MLPDWLRSRSSGKPWRGKVWELVGPSVFVPGDGTLPVQAEWMVWWIQVPTNHSSGTCPKFCQPYTLYHKLPCCTPAPHTCLDLLDLNYCEIFDEPEKHLDLRCLVLPCAATLSIHDQSPVRNSPDKARGTCSATELFTISKKQQVSDQYYGNELI